MEIPSRGVSIFYSSLKTLPGHREVFFCKKDYDMHRTATGLIVYNIENLTKI
ncbi:hypothetical protein KM907_00580 [Bacillus haynesii]|nr:hypothetical protein [Bacillus haynesii]